MAKETAEQKLLKIIEATEAQQAATATATQPASAAVQQVADSVKSTGVALKLSPFIELIFGIFKNKSAGGQLSVAFGLKEINYVLFGIIGLVILFLLFDFSKGMNYAQQVFPSSGEKSLAGLSEDLIPTFKDISEYIEAVGRRNIFQPLEKKEEVVQEEVTPKDMRKIVEQAKELKLVGVSWLNTADSASALIENTGSGITYFLKRGETINGVAVKEIFADSVILSYEGDDIKLNL